jgi:hypothetical protein
MKRNYLQQQRSKDKKERSKILEEKKSGKVRNP